MRQILKRLQVPLPHKTGFNTSDNPYTSSEFFKICDEYGVPNDPMKYQDETFYLTYQHRVSWPDDCIGLDSMTSWIIEKSVGFTYVVGLYKISESVRAYAYLILSSQASARSSIIENTASAFLNNFEDIVNRRVDIREDIKRYQDTLSYASSKIDYSIVENLYMLPSDMNLKIRSETVMYNNKSLVSDEKFSLGKNKNVNLTTPTINNHKTNSVETPAMKSTQTVVNSERTADLEQKSIISHQDEKVALVLSLNGIFMRWFIFR